MFPEQQDYPSIEKKKETKRNKNKVQCGTFCIGTEQQQQIWVRGRFLIIFVFQAAQSSRCQDDVLNNYLKLYFMLDHLSGLRSNNSANIFS